MNVVFAAGGTGGHIYPAIAIADALHSRATIDFIGSAERMEARIVPEAGYGLHFVSASPKNPVSNLWGVTHAIRLLRNLQPRVVVATGGYVCFPAVVAARLLRTLGMLDVRIALLEPNAVAGRTNRALAPIVDEVWGAFPRGDDAFRGKYVCTGIPVRRSLLERGNRVEAARKLNLDPSRRTILILGGSQGARTINEAAAALVTRRALPVQWQVLHASGERDYEYMRSEERRPFGENRVTLVPYLENITDAYACSDIVVARAGASTLGELAALGIPSVLVPYPFAAHDHQQANAHAFSQAGAALTIDDGAVDADSLWWALREAMEPLRLEAMRAAARSLAGGDPLVTILARIEALAARTYRA